MTSELVLREVANDDLPRFFEYQRDADASRMAGVPPRDRDAFAAHGNKILQDGAVTTKSIRNRSGG